jgi:ubiquinone/menaquinone biosynthesis C-methylase UbiE
MNQINGGNTLLDANLILSKAQVGDRKKVAHLGCGASGHFVFPSARIVGKRGQVYAVDILKTVLERVERQSRQENLLNIQVVWSDLEVFGATKIESSSLDSALLVNVLYESKKRAEILREAIRLLKKDGHLVIVDWKNISTPFGPPIEERVRQDLLETAGKKLGLSLEEEFVAGPYHYGLVFVK